MDFHSVVPRTPPPLVRVRALLACTLLSVGLTALNADAQTHGMPPKPFDVTSVKPNNSGSNSSSMATSHGKLTATNVTARALILRAFQLKEIQLSGDPGWIDTDRFDIAAKTEDRSISDDDLWLFLQPLLIERFHLRFHRAVKQGSILSLVNAKAKPGLASHSGADAPLMRISISAGKATINAADTSMTKLASTLANFTQHLVVDNTGRRGGYDFKLEWAQDHPEESGLSSLEESLGLTGPSIYTALQEQLGLKLQHATGQVETLVIDSIDRPTAN